MANNVKNVKFVKSLEDINKAWDNFRKAMDNIEGVDRYELSISLRNRSIKNGSYAHLILESMKRK